MNIHDSPAPEQGTIVLVSGGIDSAVTLALARQNSKRVEAITFDYNQPHIREKESAKALCKHYNIPHLERNLYHLGYFDENTRHEKLLPGTWIPGRNLLFLVYAAISAHNMDLHILALGAHQEDYPGSQTEVQGKPFLNTEEVHFV